MKSLCEQDAVVQSKVDGELYNREPCFATQDYLFLNYISPSNRKLLWKAWRAWTNVLCLLHAKNANTRPP